MYPTRYYMGGYPFLPRQLLSDWKYSISMRPYFVVCGNHFATWAKNSMSYSLCHKMTLHMSVRQPLCDVNKTLTEAFHYIIIQLSFHNPNADIVLQWTQPEICVTSWEVSPSSTTQGFNNAQTMTWRMKYSMSMGLCCMVRGSHFVTRHKHSRSYFVTSHNNSRNECVGLIGERQIHTAGVISLYYNITLCS